MKGYIVNYSVRYRSGQLVNRMYHRHLWRRTWEAANASAKILQGRDPLGVYDCDDYTVTAVEQLPANAITECNP